MSTPQPAMVARLDHRHESVDWAVIGRFLAGRLGYPIVGIAVLLAVWWLGGWLIASNPDTESFADFAPAPAFAVVPLNVCVWLGI